MNNPADNLVVFSNVTKNYDGKTNVVEGLNLDITKGEFLTLLGPSGSGKTTTLMMLAGFEAPSSGRIEFAGKSITSVPTYKRNFGMVFQNYALFPHMTVSENLAFPLRMRKIPKQEIAERVKKTLGIVQLTKFADRKPAQLSGGQAQRVALARSIVFKPRMVLMDEPLGALDKQLREQMQLEIKRLHHELGITMLYVTHDQTEALTMSDRIAVFNNGRIQQIGSPTQMYGSPANKFVASFMGENNSLDARVTKIHKNNQVSLRLERFNAEVMATSENSREVGQSVKVMVRPEDVHLVKEGSKNSFTSKISDTIYHGDHLRLVFGADVDIEGSLTTRVQHHNVTSKLKEGAEVTLSWDPNDATIFKV